MSQEIPVEHTILCGFCGGGAIDRRSPDWLDRCAEHIFVCPKHPVYPMLRALTFIRDLAEEELPHNKVGTGAEIALRHISRKAREVLVKAGAA